jgi:hypothetical protein
MFIPVGKACSLYTCSIQALVTYRATGLCRDTHCEYPLRPCGLHTGQYSERGRSGRDLRERLPESEFPVGTGRLNKEAMIPPEANHT